MWEVDHIKTLKDNTVLFAFTKIGTYAVAPPEEMFVMASANLLTETDPHKVDPHITTHAHTLTHTHAHTSVTSIIISIVPG